jgi:hypothetical protein
MWGVDGNHPLQLCMSATKPINAFLAPCVRRFFNFATALTSLSEPSISSNSFLKVNAPPLQFTHNLLIFKTGVMMMRAYAFTSRNRRVLIILGTCYIILIGVNIWVFCIKIDIPAELYVVLGDSGCFANYGPNGTIAMRIGVSSFTRTPTIDSDPMIPTVHNRTVHSHSLSSSPS